MVSVGNTRNETTNRKVHMDPQKTRQDLLKLPKPVILIAGDITRAKYNQVADDLIYLDSRGSPGVEIRIDSPGGSCSAGFDIYDLLQLYKGKTKAVVQNRALSIAAVILQACTRRICMRHAKILIHGSGRHVRIDEIDTPKELVKTLADMRKFQDRIDTILSQRTKKSLRTIRRVLRKNQEMDSEEALEFGLIDEIV